MVDAIDRQADFKKSFDKDAELEGAAIRSLESLRDGVRQRVKVKLNRFQDINRTIHKGNRHMARTKANIPENETNAQKFIRLAEYRVSKIVDRIRGLAYLANKTQYSYSPEQIKRIEEVLHQEVAMTCARFNQAKMAKQTSFSFSKEV